MHFGAKGTQSSELALEFTRALTRRDYRAAYSMTSREFQSRFSCEEM